MFAQQTCVLHVWLFLRVERQQHCTKVEQNEQQIQFCVFVCVPQLRGGDRPPRCTRCSPSLCIPVVYYKRSLCHPEISCHNIWTAADDSCVFALFHRHGGQRSGLIRWSVRIWRAEQWEKENIMIWFGIGVGLLFLCCFNIIIIHRLRYNKLVHYSTLRHHNHTQWRHCMIKCKNNGITVINHQKEWHLRICPVNSTSNGLC